MEDESDAYPEIAAAIATCLNRFGTAGHVEVKSTGIVLSGYGPTVTVELGSIPENWRALSFAEREHRAFAVARQLSSLRRASVQAARTKATLPSWLFVLLSAVAFTVLAFLWSTRSVAPRAVKAIQRKPAAPSSVAASPTETERDNRAARVCQATRARVMRGASVGPVDVEGWVVEIAILRSNRLGEFRSDPALQGFVAAPSASSPGAFIWNGVEALAAVKEPSGQFEIIEERLPAAGGTSRSHGLRFLFSGAYVAPYFRAKQRVSYHVLANELTEKLAAERAAVYARCAAERAHALGSWFYGKTPGQAIATLIYYMGSYADVLQIAPSHQRRLEGGGLDREALISALDEAARGLAKRQVASLVGAESGMIAGPEDGPSILTFPFSDGNRAGRASLRLARALGLARAH